MRARLIQTAGMLLLAGVVAGCTATGIRPLYYGGSSGPAAAGLASVDIAPIEGRVGQVVRNELLFGAASEGGQTLYNLEITVLEGNQAAIVDPFSGRSEVVSTTVSATYVLRAAGAAPSAPPLKKGSTFARASYNATLQRFANIRAQRDAEDRAAKVVAEQIRTQLASYFATRS